MNAIAAIYTARRQLGLDDDTARDLYQRETGKRSLRDMSEGEQRKVLDALRGSGFKQTNSALQGPFAKKLQALWIAAHNLGIVQDNRDQAMLAFVKRQTGIDHTRFLLDAEDADKAIEALKGWMAREAGVNWATGIAVPAWSREPGAKIAMAQWAILSTAGVVDSGFAAFKRFVDDHAFNPLGHMSAREWQAVTNMLGTRVRKVKKNG